MQRSVSPMFGPEILTLSLAALGALCLTLQFLIGWATSDILLGSLIGWACAVVVGALSLRAEWGHLRSGIAFCLNFLLPLPALWQAPALGVGWMLAGGVSLSYLVSLVTWSLGLVSERNSSKVRSFQMSLGGGGRNSPIAGCLVTGLLAFALPLPNPLAPLLALGYLASLLALASLGALESRRRAEGAVSLPFFAFLSGWGSRIVGLLALALLTGTAGVGAAHLAQTGRLPFLPGSGSAFGRNVRLPWLGAGIVSSGNALSSEGTGSGIGGKDGASANGSVATPPSFDGKRSLPDLLPLLRRSLPLLLLGLTLAYLLTRYGAPLLRWLKQGCGWLLRPLAQGLHAWKTGLATRRREAALRAIIATLPDPYAPVGLEDTPERLFQKWAEAASFVGVELREQDGVFDFAYRLERSGSFSAGEIQVAALVCSQSAYGANALDPERVAQARGFIQRFQEMALQKVSPQQCAQRREERLRSIAAMHLALREQEGRH